jgi:Ribbon-helix-helix domain
VDHVDRIVVHSRDSAAMGKTKRRREAAYLDHEKFYLLVKLAEKKQTVRSVLLREAVDDLLTKHGMLKPTRHV